MEDAGKIIFDTLYRIESTQTIIGRLAKSLKRKVVALEKELKENDMASIGGTVRDIHETSDILSELDKKINVSDN